MEKIEAQKRYAAKEAYEAETVKREAEELSKREELEIMERIEREKHDIERENMTLSVRKSKQQKSNVRKSAKQLKGMTNCFAKWKRQNWH